MTDSNVTQQPTRVVVLGAGYAGLLFTVRLAGKVPAGDVSITLVNDADTFTERLRLHQYATNQTIKQRPIARTLRGTGVRFVRGRATALDTARRVVTVAGDEGTLPIAYDYLVYALGSLTGRQGVPGVDEHAYTLAPRGPLSAEALRAALPPLQARGGRVVVVGGGPTGIETAAEFASAYPRLRVELVTEGALGMFLGGGVAAYMRRSLDRLGVTVTDHTGVAEVRADGVVTGEGRVISCDLCLWAGGFVAPPLAREAGLPVNERDQVIVDRYLRTLGHPEIYVVGDAAHPREDPGVALRMSAGNAAILGAHGADSLAATLRGKTPKPLSFAYLGQAVALGRHNAIGFNNYPNDRPHRPYFTGRLGYQVRDVFVRFLATTADRERLWPGFFAWPGKGRYAAAQRGKLPQQAVVTRDERVLTH